MTASARKAALLSLDRVFSSSVHPKDALEDFSSSLDQRDRSFSKELLYGVLRHRDYLDWVLDFFLKKRSGLSLSSLNNLRLAVYQARFLRVPDWAFVNEAVEMEKELRGRPSVINAVLRNLIRHGSAIKEPEDTDMAQYISIKTSHPAWLVRRWIKRFGEKEALQLALANNELPPLCLRLADPGRRERLIELLQAQGIAAEGTKYSPAGVVIKDTSKLSARDIFMCPGSELDEETRDILGTASAQDEASQLISLLLSPAPGSRVLDACAAPGGKTAHLASLMKDTGEILAVESGEKRIPKLKSNIERLGLRSVSIMHADARELSGAGRFDSILLDAPCSATGVIRRNPDIKYRITRNDLQRLAARQLELMLSVSSLLKPGGRMVYSVCSFEPDEGEEVVKVFLQKTEGFSIISEAPDFMHNLSTSEGSGMYRTYPHRHAMDGFFAALLQRRA
ncbi:MAG: 16S rRNA (cytosine(967)-C(5))-methyltransferase RsmB [Nitrospiraceae bacterium]|nr:16S rRNA (cytosine(967)-C(5))-methyltransferase RsmB [Nitrospiraceae bacterium]